MAAPFDPRWLREGVFDVSSDPRGATRTVEVRRTLERLQGGSLRLVKFHPHGHSPGYYLRQGSRGEVEAQYCMSIDRELRTLSLGLSVEKGEEHPQSEHSRRMSRDLWDWPRLVAMGARKLHDSLSAISSDLERPLAVIIATHRQDKGEMERETTPFVFTGKHFLVQSAPVGIDALVDRLREVDERRDWWADVWIVADFAEVEVSRLFPDDVARCLFTFDSLRRYLRGKDEMS